MVNCFLLFCSENRAKVSSENPEQSNADVTSKLGKLWRELPDNQKKYYKERASRDIKGRRKKNNLEKQYLFKFKVQLKPKNPVKYNLNTSDAPNLPKLPSIQQLLLCCPSQ